MRVLRWVQALQSFKLQVGHKTTQTGKEHDRVKDAVFVILSHWVSTGGDLGGFED